MKKLKHIYLVFPVLLVFFFFKSSFAVTNNSTALKNHTFEVKASGIILSDFEDTDEYQNKIRFSEHEFIPFLLIKNDPVLCSVSFFETSSSFLFSNPAKKRAFISVFRL